MNYSHEEVAEPRWTCTYVVLIFIQQLEAAAAKTDNWMFSDIFNGERRYFSRCKIVGSSVA
jgi:hypothetical protein